MEQIVQITTTGIAATDNTTYATLTLLKAAGKTAFPNISVPGTHIQSLFLSADASGGGAGGEFTYRTNVNDGTLPSVGIPVYGSGQIFVRGGVSPISIDDIVNVVIISKVSGDTITLTAVYD